MKKRFAIGFLIALLALIALVSSAFAVSGTFREIAGLGSVTFTDEVLVERISVVDADSLTVQVSANPAAEADHTYGVFLYLNGAASGLQFVSWTATEIPGTPKLLTFDGLALSGVTGIAIEIQR